MKVTALKRYPALTGFIFSVWKETAEEVQDVIAAELAHTGEYRKELVLRTEDELKFRHVMAKHLNASEKVLSLVNGRRILSAVETTRRDCGISDEAIKRTIGKTLVESFSLLSGITDADTLEAYRKEYVKEADKYMTANTRLFPETSHVLTTLKARGAKLGIISTKYRYRIMELLGHALPESTVDLIVGGEDVQTPKPSPEGVFIALEKLQTEKTDVLYVGDSTVDAETARAAGIDFAGVLHGTTTREELAAYPHTGIMNDLTALLKNE